MIRVEQVTSATVESAGAFFDSNPTTKHCYCMWFLIPVTEYHAGGHERNKQQFRHLAEASPEPVGLLAYKGDQTVGWCAAGPRSRYARAIRTPTFRGRDAAEDERVWLVPCFFVRKDAAGGGVATALLQAAVDLAASRGATAIEGFPFARGARPSRESMVGRESTFERCGFDVSRRPSKTRVVMRRDLSG